MSVANVGFKYSPASISSAPLLFEDSTGATVATLALDTTTTPDSVLLSGAPLVVDTLTAKTIVNTFGLGFDLADGTASGIIMTVIDDEPNYELSITGASSISTTASIQALDISTALVTCSDVECSGDVIADFGGVAVSLLSLASIPILVANTNFFTSTFDFPTVANNTVTSLYSVTPPAGSYMCSASAFSNSGGALNQFRLGFNSSVNLPSVPVVFPYSCLTGDGGGDVNWGGDGSALNCSGVVTLDGATTLYLINQNETNGGATLRISGCVSIYKIA